jgi:hypothetical protein
MFMIFAARMFESRILQAYREKVAKQREEQLLRELEEEEDSKRAKEEKRAKEAQKKKDKKKSVANMTMDADNVGSRNNEPTMKRLLVMLPWPRNNA